MFEIDLWLYLLGRAEAGGGKGRTEEGGAGGDRHIDLLYVTPRDSLTPFNSSIISHLSLSLSLSLSPSQSKQNLPPPRVSRKAYLASRLALLHHHHEDR